jgi:predicted Kef-type K+ transport protein
MEALWVGTAYGLGLGASRVGLPPLVGYLLAGFVLFGLGVRPGETLERLSEAGILLLLFTVGLKLRLATLLRLEVLGVGGLHLLLVGLGLGLLFWGLGSSTIGALFLAAGLAFSSTVLAIKLLEDKRELNSFHGRVVIGILVLQDLVAVVLLAFAGVKSPTLWALLLLLLPLLRPVVVWILEKSGHDELLLLFGLLLALGGGTLAKTVGISPELGALLMGAVLAGHPQTTELSRTLWGLKEAFLVAFFLTIGLEGLPSLGGLWMALGLLLLLPLQTVVFFALFVQLGLRVRTSFVATLALGTYSEFALITTGAAVKAGYLGEGWGPIVAVAVAASLALAAPLNRISHRLYAALEPWLLRFERRMLHPDQETTQLQGASWLVVGMGRTGGAAYKMLERQGEAVIGLDADPAKLESHQSKNRRIFYGDSEDPELWEQLDLSSLKGILLTMPDLEAKLRALDGLKRRGFDRIIAATSYHQEEDNLLEKAGASLIFRPFAEAGERLAERVLEQIEGSAPVSI